MTFRELSCSVLINVIYMIVFHCCFQAVKQVTPIVINHLIKTFGLFFPSKELQTVPAVFKCAL